MSTARFQIKLALQVTPLVMGREPSPPLSTCTSISPSPPSSCNMDSTTIPSSMDNHPLLSNLHIQGTISLSNLAPASSDFGNFTHHPPLAYIQPSSVDDIAATIRFAEASSSALTVAARGNGHSISGQAQARDGLVIDMRSLRGIEVCIGEVSYVDACGGELWIDVLKACLREGYAPPSWPDYLYFTVGGTLQNAGVGGQTFKYGPVISSVLQLEVVTGRGEFCTCSPNSNKDLFFAMLGGLGQFGIITKARILLVRAPEKVRWIRMLYKDVEEFMRDQELLITLHVDNGEESFDYVEGFVVCNNDDPVNGWGQVPFDSSNTHFFDPTLIPPSSGPFLYCLEVAKHYPSTPHASNGSMDEDVEALQRKLGFIPGLAFSKDIGYLDFLNRVHEQEHMLRDLGTWQAPHPWLCLFVPKSHISILHNVMFLKTNLRNGVGGPMHIYPVLKSKWNGKASVVIPEEEDVFYLVGLLRSNFPPPRGPKAETLLLENENILELLQGSNVSFKVYMPYFKSYQDSRLHFGPYWERFVSLKQAFDPLAILAPGQSIFARRSSHCSKALPSVT